MSSFGLECVISPVLLRVSTVVIKTMFKSNLGRKTFISSHSSQCASSRENRAGIWRQELEQRPEKSVLTDLLLMLSQATFV